MKKPCRFNDQAILHSCFKKILGRCLNTCSLRLLVALVLCIVLQAKVAAFDPNLVEIGGVYMPISGKMSADQEFAIYDQKFQKQVRL
jgi:hypothetical protein